MTKPSHPAVIPPVIPPHAEAPSWNQRGALAARPPLPLLKLSTKRVGTAVYGLSTLDAGGRIADKALIAALGWEANQRLEIRVSRGLVAVYADSRGIFKVTSRRFTDVPVIDLDSPSHATPRRTLWRHPRWLIIVATSAALLGVPGEPRDAAGSSDAVTACDHSWAVGAVVLDAETGEVLRTSYAHGGSTVACSHFPAR